MKIRAGAAVVLAGLPPGLLDGLPDKDQAAISEIVGKPVRLVGFDEDGRAELEFRDRNGDLHFIYVAPNLIEPVSGKTK